MTGQSCERLSVTAITAGQRVPSAWYRAGQLVPKLRQLGVDVYWQPAIVPKYPPRRLWLRPLWLPASVAARVPAVAASWRSDVTWFVKEMVSTLVTLEPLTRSPRVFDVDDAIWLSRGGRFARKLAQLVDLVIAGNGFLAEWFSSYNRHIVVVPTAVDTDKFCPPAENWEGERTRIGWIGTSGNLVELYRIEDALREVLVARPRSVLRVISDRPPAFSALPSERVEFVAWSRGGEVAALQEIDIGIMPLADTDWSRGKCAFKLLQYMACGRPVVASPVGVNAEILCAAGGTAAGTLQEWRDALIGLIDDREFRAEVGRRGRKLVEAEYSVKAIAPKLARCFQMLVSNKG